MPSTTRRSAKQSNARASKDALATVQAWANAFSAGDVEAIVDLFAPDVLFVGTSNRSVTSSLAGVRRYFAAAVRNIRPHEVKLSGVKSRALTDESVVVAALDVIAGANSTLTGRLTFVLGKRGGAWRIVGFHRSAMPD